MGRKGRQSVDKRRIEQQRQERQAAKRERRQESRAQTDEPVDETELLERFRVLSEAHASGAINEETFRTQRHELLVALGLGYTEPEA
jgi:hypothetical protein